MSKFKTGKCYKVNHSRKGEFSLYIESQDSDWIYGVVTDGYAGAMNDYNQKFEGEKIAVRTKFLTNLGEV